MNLNAVDQEGFSFSPSPPQDTTKIWFNTATNEFAHADHDCDRWVSADMLSAGVTGKASFVTGLFTNVIPFSAISQSDTSILITAIRILFSNQAQHHISCLANGVAVPLHKPFVLPSGQPLTINLMASYLVPSSQQIEFCTHILYRKILAEINPH